MSEQVKRGFRFLHATWRNGKFSLAEIKTLPVIETAQEFVVTKVARSLVYYRPVYRHSGEETNRGGAYVESIGKFGTHVLCAADENGKALTGASR